MSTAPVYPRDLISRAICKIKLLNILINTGEEPGAITLSEIMRDGLYFSLESITDELSQALNQLEVTK